MYLEHFIVPQAAAISDTTPQAQQASAGRTFYRPELDALRFFAFLGVFFFHTLSPNLSAPSSTFHLKAILIPGFKFAVCLFFLLSGYLITTLLSLEKQATSTIHLGSFYLRRIARIWPLYYFFFLLCLLAGMVKPHLLPSREVLLPFTFFSGNWFMLHRTSGGGAIVLLWSVNVEEQFYLVWPLCARYLRRRQLALLSIALILASYVLLIWLGVHGEFFDPALRFNTFVQMQFFAAGALLALYLPREGLRLPLIVRALLAAAALLCLMLSNRHFLSLNDTFLHHVWWTPAALNLCVLAACVALFLSFFGIPSQLLPRTLLWLGKISYGLYVYHLFVLAFIPRLPARYEHNHALTALRSFVSLLLIVLVAGLSYRWLERPFLLWKKRFTYIPNRRP